MQDSIRHIISEEHLSLFKVANEVLCDGCQLHANGLPLRHLFEHLNGTTVLSIGKSLKGCEQLPLAPFQSIRCTLPNVTDNQDLALLVLWIMSRQFVKQESCKNGAVKVVHVS
nr:unnamed protein product [Callosobruchus analis]